MTECAYDPMDIIVHRTLFGDWEITNASNFFLPRGAEANPNEVMMLRAEQGFATFEDCRALILSMQPKDGIRIIEL